MKLLIVEDEEMTREGLLHSLPFEELGITEILEARDGQEGLETAKKEHPHIIICDIRMPKMDGLTMLAKIYEFHPDIVSVLLTGHAEIEYLKKAITLNVISFIEKPVNLTDLTQALDKAAKKVLRLERQQESAQIHSTVVASRLAYQMTFPYASSRPIIDDLLKEFMTHYGTDKFQYISTIIVRPEHFPENSMVLYSIGQKLHDRLVPGHYHIIYTDKVPRDIVYHIYGSLKPSSSTLKMIGDIILSYYSSYTRCYVSVGHPAAGIQNAYDSYVKARENMGRARFFEPDSVLTPAVHPDTFQDESLRSPDEGFSALPDRYREALEDRSKERALSLLDSFKGLWYHSFEKDSMVKSIYYSMLLSLNQMYHTFHINADVSLDYPGMIIDSIDNAFSYLEIDELIRAKTEEFFFRLSNHQEEDSTIYRVKEYIGSHYMDQSLSVKSISENVFLSVSYLCTYFKNETGTTLNQYITDYRTRKAMQLLAETNMKIVDVSNAVGYRDSNYFAKIFKKLTGLSPKEYKHKSAL
ncbi:MAG: response regulator [Eubacterium sp.]|nr:response regulator [Eubacterium sp.]